MGKLYFFTAHFIDFFKYFLYFAVTIPLFKQQTHIFCRTYYNSPVNAAVSGFFKHGQLVATNCIAASKETE